jgi:hypothetical protein
VRRTPHGDPSASCMADRWSLRGRRQDRYRACPDGPAARPCDAQAAGLGGLCLRHHRDRATPCVGSDPAIWARRVPLLHPAPARCDHGEQHSRDGSQQEGDSRRQVQANSLRSTRKRRPGTPPGRTNSRQRHRQSIRLAGALLRPGGALPAASAGAPGFPGCPRDHAGHSPGPGSFAGKVTLTSYGTGSSAPNPSHGAGGCGTSAAELRDFAALP